MASINAFLTDLDGTLCSTVEANVESYKAAFFDAGVPFNEQIYRDNFGLDFHSMMKVIAPSYEHTWDTIADRKAYHYKTKVGSITPNSALINLLWDAKRNGKKIGIASTAKKVNAEAVLKALDIEDLFDVRLFAEDVSQKKPNPECYIELAKKLGVPTNECVVFEDTDIGVQAGEAAGATVLRVKP